MSGSAPSARNADRDQRADDFQQLFALRPNYLQGVPEPWNEIDAPSLTCLFPVLPPSCLPGVLPVSFTLCGHSLVKWPSLPQIL